MSGFRARAIIRSRGKDVFKNQVATTFRLSQRLLFMIRVADAEDVPPTGFTVQKRLNLDDGADGQIALKTLDEHGSLYGLTGLLARPGLVC